MLCSDDWYQKHKNDYTQADIAALGIEVSVGDKKYPKIRQGGAKGIVGKLLEINKGETDAIL